MIRRCYNKNDQAYPDYGGRGITICDEWYTPEDHTIGWLRFKEWALANGYNDNLSIERNNVNGDYEPTNCTWTDSKGQSENTRKTKWFNPYGKLISTTKFGHQVNLVRPENIIRRINAGWSDYDAASIPARRIREKLGYMTQDIMKYNGPRYDKDDILRDSNNFIILIPRK